MPEYRNMRCCMCPNIQKQTVICPGIMGTPHPDATVCRFVKSYVDKRGWRYFVRTGIGAWKGFYCWTYGSIAYEITQLPWRETFDDAQSDLNAYAEQKGWEVK